MFPKRLYLSILKANEKKFNKLFYQNIICQEIYIYLDNQIL